MRVAPKVINKLSGDFELCWYLSFLNTVGFAGPPDTCVRDIGNETRVADARDIGCLLILS
jgi:hypothetical protein